MKTEKRWLRWLQRTLVVLVLASGGGLVVSCGSSSGAPCDQMCDKLEGCGLAIRDAEGKQLSVAECKSQCKALGYESKAACINKLSGCDAAQITACIAG